MNPDLSDIMSRLGLPPDYGVRRGLAFYDDAPVLRKIGKNPYGKQVYLSPKAADAWEMMKKAANINGVILIPLSGYRSIAMQTEIILSKLHAGRSIQDIMKANAPPGFSQHHSGRALDMGTVDFIVPEQDFDKTPAFSWLSRHAKRFGYVMSYPENNSQGFMYEPWHWYFV
jgi:zinc D-Ala-D-Ala carboxypeptidase